MPNLTEGNRVAVFCSARHGFQAFFKFFGLFQSLNELRFFKLKGDLDWRLIFVRARERPTVPEGGEGRRVVELGVCKEVRRVISDFFQATVKLIQSRLERRIVKIKVPLEEGERGERKNRIRLMLY